MPKTEDGEEEEEEEEGRPEVEQFEIARKKLKRMKINRKKKLEIEEWRNIPELIKTHIEFITTTE